MLRVFLLLAAVAGFFGVALGAFAAHGLKGQLSPEYLAVFQTGVHYQLVHALALFGVALLANCLAGAPAEGRRQPVRRSASCCSPAASTPLTLSGLSESA